MISEYNGKKILLASMHQKELVIKPTFEEYLGCEIIVAKNFNTDQFGTFSGEISRELSAYETLKKKAITASNIFNYDYVISSEGSFGQHHQNFFTSCDTEMLLFYDRIRGLYIADYEVSSDTNYAELEISSGDFNKSDYLKWLGKVKFPSHGIIVKAGSIVIKKGICNHYDLEQVISSEFRNYHNLKLETDMRAMMNPSRMNVIDTLTHKLARRVATTCKKCNTPGFGKLDVSGYLDCKLCSQQTKVPKFKALTCFKCDYFEIDIIDQDIKFADPLYCDYCNP